MRDKDREDQAEQPELKVPDEVIKDLEPDPQGAEKVRGGGGIIKYGCSATE
jgi:hypothetical protein